MNNRKNLLGIALFSLFVSCYAIEAMKRILELDDKSDIAFLIQAAEEREVVVAQVVPEIVVAQQRNVKPKSVHNYYCERYGCGFSTQHENRMIKHRKIHEIKDTMPEKIIYRCDICDYMHNAQRSMKVHAEKHNDEKKYHCNVCDTWFQSDRSRKRHIAASQKHQDALALAGQSQFGTE